MTPLRIVALQNQSSRPVSVYALVDPVTDEVRYVGATQHTLARRLTNHRNQAARESTPKGAWLRDLKARGLVPRIILLEVTDTVGARDVEWTYISHYRATGCDLTNGKHRQRYQPGSWDKVGWVALHATVPQEMRQELRAMATKACIPLTHLLYQLLREALAARAATRPAAPAPEQGEQP